MKNDPASNYITENELFAAILELNAERVAMLKITTEVASRAGITEIDGLTLPKWFSRQRIAELERSLIAVEDTDPTLAARLQQQIDAWKIAPESN